MQWRVTGRMAFRPRVVARPRRMDLDTRMTRLTFGVLIGCLLPALCPAQDHGGVQPVRVASKFFYTVPAGKQDEWAYSMPECRAIPSGTTLGLRDCIAFKGHQMCESSKSVELTNILTNETRNFMLIYHVFGARRACVQSRRETLKGH